MSTTKNAAADLAEHLDDLREKLALGKEEFAKRLGFTRIAVLHWENGRSEPSADVYMRLAKLAQQAGRPQLAIWFWDRAGVDRTALRTLLPEFEQILRRDSAHRKDPPSAGVIGVPLLGTPFFEGTHERVISKLQSVRLETVGIESFVAFPASIIPNPRSTVAVRAPDDYMRPFFRRGDIVAIDTTISVIAPVGSERLEKALLGATGFGPIAAYFRLEKKEPHEEFRRGLHLRKISFSGAEERTNVVLSTELGDSLAMEVNSYTPRDPEGLRKYLGIDARQEAESMQVTVTGDGEWSILGAVVAWIGSNPQPGTKTFEPATKFEVYQRKPRKQKYPLR